MSFRKWFLPAGAALFLCSAAGCNLVLGDLDTRFAEVDGGGTSPDGGRPGPGAGNQNDGGCVSDHVALCAGRCGTLLDSCGVATTCPDCAFGTCGGGGPNTCGSNTCVPSCTGKTCGQSDGCSALCNAGCACGPATCQGCCDLYGTCQTGTSDTLCGAAGGSCVGCGSSGACSAEGTCLSPTTPSIVMFGGGVPGGGASNATWEFDGVAWTQRALAGTSPVARSAHSATTLGTNVVLFGGASTTSTELGDTWLWNGASWSEVATTGPAARDSFGLATLGGNVYLFGGEVEDFTTGAVTQLFNDTWKWNGSSWAQVTTIGQVPAPRSAFGMAALGGKIYIFGGYTQSSGDGGVTESNLNDTWQFDGATWSPVSVAAPPTARNSMPLTTYGSSIVMFSGYVGSAGPQPQDTWTFNGATWQSMPVTSPPARGGHSAAVVGSKLVVAGGTADGTNVMSDAWEWNGGTWTEQTLAAGPPAVLGASMAHAGSQ